MSKQEKLEVFLGEFARWYTSNHNFRDVNAAWKSYANTPDDPPQPPEMPEWLTELIGYAVEGGHCPDSLIQRIRDHYRHPLKLEVGKVYEDEQGYLVDVVWHNTFFVDHFIGVRREGGLPRIYSSCGVCTAYCDSNIIKEVKHQ